METKVEITFSKKEKRELDRIIKQFYTEMEVLNQAIISYDFIYGIFIALIKSVPIKNFVKFCMVHEKYDNSEYLEILYRDYSEMEKRNWNSKDLKKRTEAKYKYYKRAFKLRCKIQNVQWDYRDLDKKIKNFIEGKEDVYIAYKKVQTMEKRDYQCCLTCNTKWLKDDKDICPRCEKVNDLAMFIKLTNYFCVLGDMEKFYNSLDDKTSKILYDNWDYILKYFEKKRRQIYHKNWTRKVVEYGIPQYNKIIKLDGGEWALDPEFKEFNKKYNMALVSGTFQIDFNKATSTTKEDFLSDISKLRFPFCKLLILPEVQFKSNLNLFEPNMPKLVHLVAKNCYLKEVDLKVDSFPYLKELNIDDNLIEKYDNIKNLINIESLKIVTIFGNPIEKTNEIYIAEKAFGMNIDLRYNYNRKYMTKINIDEESDSEIKEIEKKWIDFSDSEFSESNEK